MGAFDFRAETNTTPQSYFDVTSYQMPARAFFFVIVDEVGRDGFLVRKIYASTNSPYLASMNLSPLKQMSELYPEKYGLSPKTFEAPTSVAEHVMGNNKSPYISTSSIFPEGSPRFEGREIFIDIEKARASGAKLISTEEIVAALRQYQAQNPHLTKRIEKIIAYVRDVDKEILIHGERVPAKAVFNPKSLGTTNKIIATARVVQVIGVALTAYDLEQATEKSFKAKSVKPISAEVIRQAGGWGGAIAGFKVGGIAGAAVGIETGPGAIITGIVGGIIFGSAGYFGADWVADHVDKN